ncbi:hypothetical protein A3I56_02505 [Candidatus Roizmanbacteria bacterium RIFCSPLOWO2_02_FULL_43_10]|uniref:Uncharacterized protein n=1 Tax=Candidatus Roizmanbacteria bacterium RIFCSPLOWO2_02_FULL_43_10 TaxID=1802078 RepID=A0A1F7JUP9_9BACT|nr:MAG: hypothetical protein A3I56_02505 [Candidatus Roizmanbacteria bacterium RIFCSPLOWO2_02_FULL_43_10]
MKDIELNPLTKGQRKLLQLGIILILGIFLIGYFFLVSKRNSTVYLENQNLHVFDDSITFTYPDRLSMHSPYLLVVKPEKQITYIYNLEQKKKEKEVKEIALDYQNGKLLYVKGATTFIDTQDLGVLCEQGIIKSEQELLCVTKVNPNSIQNKLISIDLETKKQKDIYISQNIISDVNFIDKSYYIGEIDFKNNKSYLVINGSKPIKSPNIVSLIYEMNGGVYFASFKSALNQEKESYYAVIENKAAKQEDNKIYLLK